MADRAGLRIVGFLFASVTLAVMLASAMVVTSHATGDNAGFAVEMSSAER